MAYDELLSVRIRAALGSLPSLEEKKMFGGVGFLINGNTLAPAAHLPWRAVPGSAGVACGVHKNDVIVRVATAKYEEALSRPYTRVFDMTGRPMSGWVTVEPKGCETEADLKAWVEQGVAFVRSLPAKEK